VACLQHAIRSFIDLEQKTMVVKSRLDLLVGGDFPVSYGSAIAYWIALLAIGQKLLPTLLAAGSILQVEGYDYDPDTAVDPAKQLPCLYEAWCKSLTSSLESVDEVLNSELDTVLEEAGWSEDILQELESNSRKAGKIDNANNKRHCSVWRNDYSLLGIGIIEPRWISFTECASSKHRYNYSCQDFLESQGRSGYGHRNDNMQDESDSDDEAFQDAEAELANTENESDSDESAWTFECNRFIQEIDNGKIKDPVRAVAAHLYRTQARIWLGTNEPGELFCGTCF